MAGLTWAQIFALLAERDGAVAFVKDVLALLLRHRAFLDRAAAILGADKTIAPAPLPAATKAEVMAAVNLHLSDYERAQQQREERGGA